MTVTERISAQSRSYDIIVGPDALDSLADSLSRAGAFGDVVLVTDENVAALHADRVRNVLARAGIEPRCHVIAAGEGGKSRESLAGLHDALAEVGVGRDGMLLALGGGVVSDLTGFAAATWMRGVAFAALPTTLLAMADASVGGKTAVNVPAGKNLVGAFHQPHFVLADTKTLGTLPDEEVTSGLGEVVKSAVIGDADLFGLLEDRTSAILGRDPDVLAEIVVRCVRVKAAIVARDEREASERRLLNLGHTLGHALETATGYKTLRHGEAVAIGMVFIARVAAELGRIERSDVERIEALVGALGLPTEVPPGISATDLEQHVLLDKKVRGGEPEWVLPVEIGRCVVTSLPDWRDRL
jgi:3-dehydroquinate synthase